MQTPATDAGETNDSSLLFLREVPNDDGGLVQHFVCSDCLNLVETEAGSTNSHDCPAMTQQTGLE